jgi:hypothetical protein
MVPSEAWSPSLQFYCDKNTSNGVEEDNVGYYGCKFLHNGSHVHQLRAKLRKQNVGSHIQIVHQNCPGSNPLNGIIVEPN